MTEITWISVIPLGKAACRDPNSEGQQQDGIICVILSPSPVEKVIHLNVNWCVCGELTPYLLWLKFSLGEH